jgi:uncharacterized protein
MILMSKIKEIKDIVKAEIEKSNTPEQYKLHFIPVFEYSMKLAEITGANKEVVELAAWLHDLGRVKFGPEDHHKTGAVEAEKILRNFGYPEETIKHVKECILTHRSMERDEPPRTIEAKIIASADAMAHYDTIPWLLVLKFKKTGNLKESVEWVLEKVNRGWEKKILIPEGKDMIKEKYKAAKLLLESTLKYLK